MPTDLPQGLIALLGVFAPVVIQLVTRYIPSKIGRYAVALLLSAVTGIAAMFWAGVPWAFTVEWICVWYTLAQISFHLFWQPVYNVTGVLKRVAE